MNDQPDTVWEIPTDTKIKIGKLVIDLVMGDKAIPNTPAERIALLEENGIVFNENVQDVEILQSTTEHMYLTLPPKKFLERGVHRIENEPEKYAVPEEYAQFERGDLAALIPEKMYHFRIGDYTLSHCM